MKGRKKLFKRKIIHDFNAFLTQNPLIVFSISYTVPEIIKKKHEKMVLQKTLYSTEYHLFFSQLRAILFCF